MEATPRLRRYVLAALLAMGVFPVVPAAESPPIPQILFLSLKLENDQVSLVRSFTAPGTLKPAANHTRGLDLELTSAAGQVLWTHGVADPSLRRLEYEDPDHPGRISARVVQLTNVEFIVRVPALTNAQQVHFYRPQAAAGTNNATATGASTEKRQSLGHVTLPATADH